MSTKHEYKKLQEALRTIKEECSFHSGSCLFCPFAEDSYKCGITGACTSAAGDYRLRPQYWIIPEIKLLRKEKEVTP